MKTQPVRSVLLVRPARRSKPKSPAAGVASQPPKPSVTHSLVDPPHEEQFALRCFVDERRRLTGFLTDREARIFRRAALVLAEYLRDTYGLDDKLVGSSPLVRVPNRKACA